MHSLSMEKVVSDEADDIDGRSGMYVLNTISDSKKEVF